MRLFNRGVLELLSDSGTSWNGSSDVRLLLVDTDYTFNPDQDFVADLSADEISTTNYARQTVGSRTLTLDDTNNGVVIDAADITFTALGPGSGGPTIGAAIVYRHTGNDATAPLIGFIQLADTVVNGGNIVIQFAATGLTFADSPS